MANPGILHLSSPISLARVTAFAGAASVLCSAICISLLVSSPISQNYHLSPYAGLSSSYWMLVGAAYLFTAIGLYAASGVRSLHKAEVTLCYVSLLLVVSVSAFEPYLRGALLANRVDTLAYVGGITDALSTGRVNTVYPAFHLEIIGLVLATGIDPIHLVGPFGPFVVILGLLFYYVLARSISRSAFFITTTMLAVATFQMGYIWSRPYEFGVALLPLLFAVFLLARHRRPTWGLIVMVLAFLFTVVHPIIAVINIACMAVLSFGRTSVNRLGPSHPALRESLSQYAIIGAVAFLLWMGLLHQTSIGGPILALISAILGDSPATVGSYIAVWGISPFEALILIVKTYASNIILASFFVAMLIRWRTRSNSSSSNAGSMRFFLSWTAIVSLLLGISLLNIRLITFDVRRLVSTVALFAPILFGLSVSLSLDREKAHRIGTLILIIGLVSSFMLASAAIYQSPYIGVQNQQVMEGELAGVAWLIDEVSASIRVYDLGENEYLRGSFGGSVDYNSSYSQYQLMTKRMVENNSLIGPAENHIFTVSILREVRISSEAFPTSYYVTEEMLVEFYSDQRVSRISDNADYVVYYITEK